MDISFFTEGGIFNGFKIKYAFVNFFLGRLSSFDVHKENIPVSDR